MTIGFKRVPLCLCSLVGMNAVPFWYRIGIVFGVPDFSRLKFKARSWNGILNRYRFRYNNTKMGENRLTSKIICFSQNWPIYSFALCRLFPKLKHPLNHHIALCLNAYNDTLWIMIYRPSYTFIQYIVVFTIKAF